jgi:hypothetical protein
MRKIQQILFTIVFCGAPCLVFTPVADACGVPSISQTFTKAQLRTDPRNPLDSVSAASVTRDLNFASAFRPASIVGMWDTQFISEGNTTLTPPIPDGAVIDFGYVQWHGEGTELFNSGSRAPATQNFCMGVWVPTGLFTYDLNHYAFTYDTSGNPTGTANIQESVTLSFGGTLYSGTFTTTLFDTTGTQTAQLTGQISATRITVDTPPLIAIP